MVQLGLVSSRSVKISKNKLKKNLEKLSSAMRINRAGDGAAELAISEKMKAESTLLGQAIRNAKDGISLVQTAEGALEEVHTMLNRLLQLADESSNGTYDDNIDRSSLQREVEQLQSEIDRIANYTDFNGIPLLNGNLQGMPEWSEEQVHTTLSEIEGAAHKDAVKTGAVWEGTVDLSNVKDGSLLIINGETLEFDTDNKLNDSSHHSVDIMGLGAGVDKSAALTSAINNIQTLKSCLKALKISQISSGSDRYAIRLEQAVDSIKNDGEVFTLSGGDSNPDFSQVQTQLIKDTTGFFGDTVVISNLNLNDIRDGTILTLFGTDYEIDLDGASTSSNLISVPNGGNLKSSLESSIDALSCVTYSVLDPDHHQLTINCNTTITISDDDINNGSIVKFQKPACTPDVKGDATKSQAAVDTPEIVGELASKTEQLNLAAFQEGDIIAINGVKYELDWDGQLSENGNIGVDIRSAKKPSDIAAQLEKAINTGGYGYTAKITVQDDNSANLEVTSDAKREGEQIEIQYQISYLDDKDENDLGLILQIGTGSSGQLKLNIDSMKTADLGIDKISVGTQGQAASAAEVIRGAIDQVSSNRGTLGAMQNRLEHAYQNLGVSHENTTQTEDRISGADIAEEVMDYTKNQIIAQSAQGMLSQAMNLTRSRVQQLLEF